jgi:hypothetical protein
MRSREFIIESQRKVILEGGNMFTDASQFDQKYAKTIVDIVNKALAKTGIRVIPVGSGATPTAGKMSGDFDVMADEEDVKNYFNVPDAKSARKALNDYLHGLGFNTAQSGINVHILIPLSDGTKAQTDIMVTPQAATISKFHVHTVPQGSPYKGKNKILLMTLLAKQKGMLWSPWQGLFMRDASGKKGEFVSNDIDQVAKTLIGGSASGKDLGSVESILAAMPQDQAQRILADIRNDPNWEEKKGA